MYVYSEPVARHTPNLIRELRRTEENEKKLHVRVCSLCSALSDSYRAKTMVVGGKKRKGETEGRKEGRKETRSIITTCSAAAVAAKEEKSGGGAFLPDGVSKQL